MKLRIKSQVLRHLLFTFVFLLAICGFVLGQTNPRHVRVSGYTKSNGTYVQPYFRTAPNETNRDNFSTQGNSNPYTGKPGWIAPDNKYNTFYYDTYSYSPAVARGDYAANSTLPIKYKNRTYIEDEYGGYSSYLTERDDRSYNIFNMKDELILYLVINHRGDWRIFDSDMIYIKTIFVETEK